MHRSIKSILFVLGLTVGLLQSPSLALSADIDALRVHLTEAAQLVAADKHSDARILLREIADRYPDSPEAYNNLAILAVYSADWKGAISLLEQALATNPSLQTSYHNLNLIYRYRAAKAYRKALADEQTDSLPPLNLTMLTEPTPTVAIPQQTYSKELIIPPRPTLDGSILIKGVADALRNWASAWSAQDIDTYLASYITHYVPEGVIDHQGWRKLRRERVLKPTSIKIFVDDESINMLSPQHALVTFTQSYRSTTFSDSVRKFIVMENTDAGWLISREHIIR